MENMSAGHKWEKIIKELMDRLKRGFLQGDTYSPVRFCCMEIPFMMLLEE